MNDLLKQGLTILVLMPVAYFSLKWIFKKSIMFKLSLVFCILEFITGYLNFAQGHLTVAKTAWIPPIIVALNIIVFWAINKIVTRSLGKAITQVKSLSEGDLTIETQKSTSSDELGMLNNSVYKLTENLKNIITELKTIAHFKISGI